jgi:protein-S-isoprenylcysteine O-methyltransferase Ste14
MTAYTAFIQGIISMNPNYPIFFFWLILETYWFITARKVKKDSHVEIARHHWFFRTKTIIVIVPIAQLPFIQKILGINLDVFGNFNTMLAVIGVIICAAGILFAIWSRRYLGSNWSTSPSIKEQHELVMSGPYRFIRHPIYTGILLAQLGSIIATGSPLWLIAFATFFIVYVYRLNLEEKLMARRFSDQYLVYKQRSKKLIPFIF